MKFIKSGLNSKIKYWIALCLLLFCKHIYANELYHYVIIGPENKNIIRVITDESSCPSLRVDNKIIEMNMRVVKDDTSTRHLKSYFPVSVCELYVDSTAKQVKLNNHTLPLFKQRINKISILGDTGCRLKAPHSYQDCSKSDFWPLSLISHSIAQEKTDLIIHVGDYLYRENPCLIAGCKNSPYGDNWSSWEEDVFKPMKELFNTSPLIATRGNHESCQRGGIGWYRFLDPFPFNPQQACLNKTQFVVDSPYSVVINSSIQLIIFDSAQTSDKSTSVNIDLTHKFEDVRQLLIPHYHHWLILHHPPFAFTFINNLGWVGGIKSVYHSLFSIKNPQEFLNNFDLLLQGHIHSFELVNYKEPFMPISLVTGMGGTQLEDDYPAIPIHYEVQHNIFIKDNYIDRNFGYVDLTTNKKNWFINLKNQLGESIRKCSLNIDTKNIQCE